MRYEVISLTGQCKLLASGNGRCEAGHDRIAQVAMTALAALAGYWNSAGAGLRYLQSAGINEEMRCLTRRSNMPNELVCWFSCLLLLAACSRSWPLTYHWCGRTYDFVLDAAWA